MLKKIWITSKHLESEGLRNSSTSVFRLFLFRLWRLGLGRIAMLVESWLLRLLLRGGSRLGLEFLVMFCNDLLGTFLWCLGALSRWHAR